jgi:hypothetical protein
VAYFEEGLLPEIRVESLKTKEDIFEWYSLLFLLVT